jgi:hypothetical protein
LITFFIVAISLFGLWYVVSNDGNSPLDFLQPKLGIPELKQLASNAGFSGDDLDTAVAIALAESGGDPEAYNPETEAGTAPGRGSYGLWQIYQTAHPEYDSATLFDPQGVVFPRGPLTPLEHTRII